MPRFIRPKIGIGIIVALLGSYAAVGAFAAPDFVPWPDPLSLSGDHANVSDHPGVGPGEDVELPDQVGGDHPGDTVGSAHEDHGVPVDSPACEKHGCSDEVEVPGGHSLNLPDPAVEGMKGAAEHRSDAQGGDATTGGDGSRGRSDGAPYGPPDGVETSSDGEGDGQEDDEDGDEEEEEEEEEDED